ncbi:MAG: 1,4-alpha-glucan branching enzyme, partial [Thermoguttaceae bacterium]
MRTSVALESIHRLIQGNHHNPFELLGPHVVDDSGRQAMAVRAFLPETAQAWVVDPGHGEAVRPMRRIHPAGLFEAICPCPTETETSRYMLRVADEVGMKTTIHDPYAFPHLLTEYDMYLLNEGRHWQSYNRLGAHLRTIDGVDGVNFAVWAPNATGV